MKELDRSSPPSAEAERPLRLPAFQREQLPNGLEIRMGVRRQLPEVSLRLVGQAGAGETSPAFAGLASLTARLLSQGAGDRGAPEMASWLGRIGASFSASAGYDATVLSMHTLASELNAALDYLAEVALRPTFADAEVERVRQERVDELRRKEDEPTHLANMGLARAIYGEHPYGVLSTGTAAAVSAIETSMVRDFHVERYGAGTATLVACGDIDPSHFAYLAERRFRDWDGTQPLGQPPALPTAAHEAGAVILIDRPGSRQSEIRIGGIGISRGAPDEFEVRVMNAILGGVFNSRVNMNLREDKGWTYGASTSFALRRAKGPFVARAAVETGVTSEALEAILAEFARLTAEPPSGDEMRLAKSALTLSLPLRFETSGRIASRVAELATYGLPDDYWLRYRDRVEDVQLDDVIRAGARYLGPESLVLLVVGDGEVVEPGLAALGPVRQAPRLDFR
jgi:zinc protease